mmetsp:Transcript_5976/g.13156  ORF Transcript_5976/g.13156 Transcript_5976/m.13156 type:complete len:265 (-) Transcript_5976:89-883(-)
MRRRSRRQADVSLKALMVAAAACCAFDTARRVCTGAVFTGSGTANLRVRNVRPLGVDANAANEEPRNQAATGGERPDGGPPPVETGRNPQDVGAGIAVGILSFPLVIIAVVSVIVGAFTFRANQAPPADVSLERALVALNYIEEEYLARGPEMGLRQRVAKWYRWAQIDKRLELEVEDLPENLKMQARYEGTKANDFLATAVEYSGFASLGDPRDSGRFADKEASRQSRLGRNQYEDIAAKGLAEGRKSLAETVRIIAEASSGD